MVFNHISYKGGEEKGCRFSNEDLYQFDWQKLNFVFLIKNEFQKSKQLFTV